MSIDIMSNNSIGDNNKIHQGDVKVNNNVNNKTVVYKSLKYPKRQSKQEREKEQKETQRPGLRDKYKKFITCFGTVVCKYPYSDRYTVINVVNSGGGYVADHIQLDFKTHLYEYPENFIGSYIRFIGVVEEYSKNDSVDYCVNISDKVDIRSPIIYHTDDIINFDSNKINEQQVFNFLHKSNITKLYDLFDYIRCKIDCIVEDMLTFDYITYYIINQYFLNTATYKIYDGEFRDQGFNEECVLDIIILLSNVLYELRCNRQTNLYTIFKNISYACNIIQGIKKFIVFDAGNVYDVPYHVNPEFVTFCKNKIGVKGKNKLKSLWYFAKLRKVDFDMNDPKSEILTKEVLLNRAYFIIQEYIENNFS